MVPPCSDRISRVPPYSRTVRNPYPYGAFTLSGATFQNASGSFRTAAGLVRVRSPLLTESRLMSFPPVTEMFQFTGFASRGYSISPRDTAEAVGCPIRKFPAQSLLAAPRDLSQRATSFIASQCQGIPRMPFSRLSRGLHAQTSARARTPRSQPVEPHSPTPFRSRERRPRLDTRPLHDVKQPRRPHRAAPVSFFPNRTAVPPCGGEPAPWWRRTGSNR